MMRPSLVLLVLSAAAYAHVVHPVEKVPIETDGSCDSGNATCHEGNGLEGPDTAVEGLPEEGHAMFQGGHGSKKMSRKLEAMCFCTTPNSGTAGHNQYKCTDGTIGYCASDEVCYAATTFTKGEWHLGCQTPCAWRQTGGCSPTGAREPNHDKTCSETIPSDHSGFCDCDGNGVKDSWDPGYDCGNTPGTCSSVCQACSSYSADNECPRGYCVWQGACKARGMRGGAGSWAGHSEGSITEEIKNGAGSWGGETGRVPAVPASPASQDACCDCMNFHRQNGLCTEEHEFTNLSFTWDYGPCEACRQLHNGEQLREMCPDSIVCTDQCHSATAACADAENYDVGDACGNGYKFTGARTYLDSPGQCGIKCCAPGSDSEAAGLVQQDSDIAAEHVAWREAGYRKEIAELRRTDEHEEKMDEALERKSNCG